MFEGLFGLIFLGLAVWAIVNIINSHASNLAKVLWSFSVIFFPILGLIVWFFAGPKSRG